MAVNSDFSDQSIISEVSEIEKIGTIYMEVIFIETDSAVGASYLYITNI